MAGDWIKMRIDLPDDVDVDTMSDILGTDLPTTVGLLFLFWRYIDRNSSDGGLQATAANIDRRTRAGFTAALQRVGWIAGEDGAFTLPNFHRHNGESAKARALEAEAKRLRRAGKTPPTEPAAPPGMSDTPSDTCPTSTGRIVRPEKRREEKSTKRVPPTPLAGQDPSAGSTPPAPRPASPRKKNGAAGGRSETGRDVAGERLARVRDTLHAIFQTPRGEPVAATHHLQACLLPFLNLEQPDDDAALRWLRDLRIWYAVAPGDDPRDPTRFRKQKPSSLLDELADELAKARTFRRAHPDRWRSAEIRLAKKAAARRAEVIKANA